MQDTFTVAGMPVSVFAPPQTPSWRVKDVAEYYGVTPNTVYKWVYRGLLRVYKTPGGGCRFVESEVKAAQVKRGAE